MNSEILTSVDDETKLRIIAGLLCEGKLTDQQKTYFLEITKTSLQQFKIQTNVKIFVEQHPDYLLNKVFPPINTKNFADGNISVGTQETLSPRRGAHPDEELRVWDGCAAAASLPRPAGR